MGECFCLKYDIRLWIWISLERWSSTLLYLTVSSVPPPFPYLPRDLCLIIYIFIILMGECFCPRRNTYFWTWAFPWLGWVQMLPLVRRTSFVLYLCRDYSPRRVSLILAVNLDTITVSGYTQGLCIKRKTKNNTHYCPWLFSFICEW